MNKDMKIAQISGAQGDVLIRKFKGKSVPEKFLAQPREDKIIVAHSETGHHHTVDGAGLTLFENSENPLICYLQMNTDVCDFTLDHHRSYDTHTTIQYKGNPGDIWEVRRQRESTPEGWARVQD